MPPCSPEAATSPLRSSVTALAATAFIGGCVHSPHGTGRCKPPRRARRWAAGPPQRLEGGKPRTLFLTSLAEPSPPSGQGEGLGPRPAGTLSDPSPSAEGGRVPRAAPAAAEKIRHSSHSPPSPASCGSGVRSHCLAAGGAELRWGSVPPPRGGDTMMGEASGEVASYTAKACSSFSVVGRGCMFPVPVEHTWASPESRAGKGPPWLTQCLIGA